MIFFITSIVVITLLPNGSVGFLTEKGNHLSSLADEDTFPSPHIIILGATGTDKSKLVNVLLGQDFDCHDCTFPICDGNTSCTEEMRYGIGQWIGVGENFTIVNTPDFEGSDSDDSELITEMINSLHDVIQTARGFLLTFRGDDDWFDSRIHQMIQEMESAFGRGFWNHVLLQFTNWHFDTNSVNHRNRTGRNEEWKTWTMNEALQERFQLDFNLSAVFIDPNAKQEWVDDEDQEVAFNREAYKAWQKIDEFCHFEFKTIEDFKADLSDCRNEVLYLNDVITKNITELTNQIAVLTTTHIEDMAALTTDMINQIAAMTKTHNEDIAALTKTHKEDMVEITSELTNQIAVVTTTHNDDMAEITSELTNQIAVVTTTHNEDMAEITSDVTKIETDLANIKTDVTAINGKVSTLETKVFNLMMRSEYCAFQNEWKYEGGDIHYDSIYMSNSNINHDEMNTSNGKFTAGVSGFYEAHVSMRMRTSEAGSYVYFSRNGVLVGESKMWSYIETGLHSSEMGARSIMIYLNSGDNLSVYVAENANELDLIMFCIKLMK